MNYTKPELAVSRFDKEDIVTASRDIENYVPNSGAAGASLKATVKYSDVVTADSVIEFNNN